MAISPEGLFDYGVVVHRSPDGVWRGRADNAPEGRVHAGLVGSEPLLELSGGVLRLQKTDGGPSLTKELFRTSGRVIRQASFSGGRLETGLNDGDRLLVSRGFTGDLAVMVVRQDTRIAGLGAVIGHFTPAIRMDEDPRVREEYLYEVKHLLDDRDVTVLWLDVADPYLKGIVKRIPDMAPGGRLVVAIAGDDADERRRVNNLMFAPGCFASAFLGMVTCGDRARVNGDDTGGDHRGH